MTTKMDIRMVWFIMFSLVIHLVQSHNVNATGSSLVMNMFSEATFAYQFVQNNDNVNYFGGGGSGTGKCNIMGYWGTQNTEPEAMMIPQSVKVVDTLICQDACTLQNACGAVSTFPRQGNTWRTPLVDIAASDSLLNAKDYASFPDLQMLPAVAGACVPIYNIPGFPTNLTLVLSRSTISRIFMGKIQYWNDTAIVNDNANVPFLANFLHNVQRKILVVVRTDSSGTTEIFSAALTLFDPIGPASFNTLVGQGPTPKWCGQKTDEVTVMNITGCATASTKVIHLKVVDSTKTVRDISFNCDVTPSTLMTLFATSASGSHSLDMTIYRQGTIYTMGYSDDFTVGMNWYQPSLVSTPVGVSVTLSTLQEGGYLNSHYNSTYAILPLIQSLWILPIGSSMLFTISWQSGITTYTTSAIDANTAVDMSVTIFQAINQALPGTLSSSTQVIRTARGSSWFEYQVTFSMSSTLCCFTASTVSPSNANNVAMFTFQNYNNYPLFYDNRHPVGSRGSGRYTCYQSYLGYQPRSYWTGSANPGMIANVFTMPYSIGYSVLTDAMNSLLPIANLINKAGAIITPTSYSVSSAVMDKGGNLDANFNAVLADSSSVNAWPMSGLTYYIIRKKHHLGSCERRMAAMTYLYNYYYSPTVAGIALRLGFATLPDYIRDIVVAKLIDTAYCTNGQLALGRYKTFPTPLISSASFQSTVSSYISVYNAIDSSATFSVSSLEDSQLVWSTFDANPATFGGAFTLLPSISEKRATYTDPRVSSFAFANVAVVPLYHLDAFTSSSNVPLRVTSQILAGIYTGAISSWNDPLLIAANFPNGQYLPNKPIIVIGRTGSTDANAIFLRYLALRSTTFSAQYTAAMSGNTSLSSKYYRSFTFPALRASGRFVAASQNLFVDNQVLAVDGTFGYYLQTTTPNSKVAWFCSDAQCIKPINPSDGGLSLANCQRDQNTVFNQVTPGSTIYSYDMMISSSPGCYPIVGSVDLSIYLYNDPLTCVNVDASGQSVVHSKIKWASFLYNGSAIVNPLQTISAIPSSTSQRHLVYQTVCQTTCGSTLMGYDICNYKDCAWINNDFVQVVSDCNPATQQRTVTYVLQQGSNATCYSNPTTMPPSKILIDCAYVYAGSSVAGGVVAMCVIGISICFFVSYLTHRYSHEKVLRRSQLIFVYIFLLGAMLMNLTVLAFYGPNSNSLCMLRVWAFNLSSTIMFAPLIMKLHRVEMFYRQVARGQRRVTISDTAVLCQVLGILSVDFIICLVWSLSPSARPQMQIVNINYGTLYASVANPTCSSSLNQPYEVAAVIWKAMLLAFGVVKSIQTWDVPEEISEAKYFAVAIYNIAVVGSFTYFLSVFGNPSVTTFVVLRSLGIFIAATVSTAVIMVPKLIAIQMNWTELLLGAKTSNSLVEYSETPDTTGPTGLGLPLPNQNQNTGNGTGNAQQSYGISPQQAFGSPTGSFRQRAANGDQLLVAYGPPIGGGGSVHGSSGGVRIGNTGLIQLVNPNTSTVACAPADPGSTDRNTSNPTPSIRLAVPQLSSRLAVPQLSIPGVGPAHAPTNPGGLIRLDVNKLSEEERAREFRNRNHDQLGNTPVNTKLSGSITPPAK